VLRDAEQIVRFWQAVEIFSPQPLPGVNVRENVTDVRPGDPMPWEAGGRLAGRPPAPGRVWRHQVFGGLFDLPRVADALRIVCGDDQPGGGAAGAPSAPGVPARGQSALFACTLDADGALASEPALSPCALALADLVASDTGADLSAGELAGRPLSGDDLREFAAGLAERLGLASLLEPNGLRVRSHQVPAGSGAGDGDEPPGQLLRSAIDGDLARVAGALRAGTTGAALAAFLGGGTKHGRDNGGDRGRIDVRQEPLTVRDGCAPSRIPPGRWPAERPLARSEQFAVNEISRSAGLFAVHAPPGTGTVPVFSDLVAAIVVERARRLAELPSPGTAFGRPRAWGSHTVSAPAPELTGFEIVLAAPDEETGLAEIGARWRDRAAEADYFPSTARLADSDGSWAMISARLGDRADRRAFVERFWHGTVRGTDVLFRAGENMPAALRRLKSEAVDWPAAVARFRAALAGVAELSSERTVAAAALTRLSILEQARDEASRALEAAQQRSADLAKREPDLHGGLVVAEERRRTCLADLAACDPEPRSLASALTGGPQAVRQWAAARGAHRALRAACAEAEEQRDAALREQQALRAGLATARQAALAAEATVARLTGEMTRLREPVARARQRWGDQVPDGPSQAETEDAALIERREKAPAWADEEYATARAELFLAALALHKTLITAEAETVERNLGALMDLLSGDGGQPPPEITLAAWQSFFLVVPVVRVAVDALGSLFAGLGRESIGWLLTASAGRLAPQQVLGGLWRASRAVLAGDALREHPAVTLPRAGRQALTKALGVTEQQAPWHASAQRFADRTARYGTRLPAAPPGGSVWVGAPLRVRRGVAPSAPVAALAALAAMVPAPAAGPLPPAVPATLAVQGARSGAGEYDDGLLVFGALGRDQVRLAPPGGGPGASRRPAPQLRWYRLRDGVPAALDDGDDAGALRVRAARRVVVHGVGREVHHEDVDDRVRGRVEPGDVELMVADGDGDVVLDGERDAHIRPGDRDALDGGAHVGLLEGVAGVAAENVLGVDHVAVEVEPVQAQPGVMRAGECRILAGRGRRGHRGRGPARGERHRQCRRRQPDPLRCEHVSLLGREMSPAS